MLLLFVLIFVVVMLIISVVNFWCQENLWLCVSEGWPNEGGDGDVVFVVEHVVIDVVYVVICVGFVGENHGEVLMIFGGVAEWSGDGGVMILVVKVVWMLCLLLLMLWLLWCVVLALRMPMERL